jgi:hypothetical protein
MPSGGRALPFATLQISGKSAIDVKNPKEYNPR